MNKKVVLVILTAATLACMLFLPFYTAGRTPISIMEIISELGFEAFTDSPWSLGILAAIIAGIVALIMAIIGNASAVRTFAVLGILGIVVYFIGCFAQPMSYGAPFDVMFKLVFSILGIGFWLSLAGFIITASVAKKN